MLRSLFALMLLAPAVHAQQRPGQVMAYGEFLGSSYGMGVSAEYAFTERVGLSLGTGFTNNFSYGFPAMLHVYSTGGWWELAGGVLFTDNKAPPMLYAGVRYVPRRFGIVLRIGGIAVLLEDDFALPGASLGLAF
jgi:hypothetical protein